MGPFKQFNAKILPLLDKMWATVLGLDNMRGDDFINIKRSDAGTTVSMNLAKVRERVAKGGDAKGSLVTTKTRGITRKAQCSEDAPAGLVIQADIYDYSTGTLQTSGDEFDVSVNCSIHGGADLDEATPRLETGKDIYITLMNVLSGTATISQWECETVFQGTEDCTCESLDAVFTSVTISPDERMTFDGVGGDTYYIYNSSTGEMEHYVDGVKVSSW